MGLATEGIVLKMKRLISSDALALLNCYRVALDVWHFFEIMLAFVSNTLVKNFRNFEFHSGRGSCGEG